MAANAQVGVKYQVQRSNEYPHIEWVELYGDGMLHECAIMRRMPSGNVLFFKTNDLDEIDRRRLAGILSDRNAAGFELWDLMSQKTLGNGMNALVYFTQLVKVISPNGKITDPQTGQIGTGVASNSTK